MKKTTEYLKMMQIYIIQGWPLQMKKKNMDKKYNHSNLFLKNYKYDEQYKNDEDKSNFC